MDDYDGDTRWSELISEDPRAAAAALWAIAAKRIPPGFSVEKSEEEDERNLEFQELEGWLRQQSLAKAPEQVDYE